jgi:hypothetical protein
LGKRRESVDDHPEGLRDLVANGVPEVEQISGNDQGRGRIWLNPLLDEAKKERLIHIVCPTEVKIRDDHRWAEAKLSHE